MLSPNSLYDLRLPLRTPNCEMHPKLRGTMAAHEQFDSTRYRYQPLFEHPWLRHEHPTFRLLCLAPGNGDTELSGALLVQHLPLSLPDSYDCLSYRWEGRDKVKSMFIHGKKVEVWENLWMFLHALRSPTRRVIVWADAVCINQRDSTERSYQVGLMGEIFRHANRIHVWLGPSTEGSDELFEWLARGHSDSDADAPPKHVHAAFLSLAQRSYWSRAWIVQECALARDIVIHCGNATIGWDAFVQRCASLLAQSACDATQPQLPGAEGRDSSSDTIDVHSHRWRTEEPAITASKDPFHHLKMLLEARNELCPCNDPGRHPRFTIMGESRSSQHQSRMPFLRLLDRFSTSECTVPLDKVFAFVPLAAYTCQSATPPRSQRNTGVPCQYLRRGCGHTEPEAHQAIKPDYFMQFDVAATRLALAQGSGNVAQAWTLLSQIFRKELEPFRRTEFLKIPVTGGPLTYENLVIIYDVTCSWLTHFTDSKSYGPVHLRDELWTAYVPWLLGQENSQLPQTEPASGSDDHGDFLLVSREVLDEVRDSMFHLHPRDENNRYRDGVLFSTGRERFSKLLGKDMWTRFHFWERILSCLGGDAERDRFNELCMPFWTWPNRRRFALPPIDLMEEHFRANAIDHQDFLTALWGQQSWPEEAWTLALSHGCKVLEREEA